MNVLKLSLAFVLLAASTGRSQTEEAGMVFFENYRIVLGGLSGWADFVHNTYGAETDVTLRVGFPVSGHGNTPPPIFYKDIKVSLSDAAGHSVILKTKDGAGDKYGSGKGSESAIGVYEIPKGWALPNSKLVLDRVSKSATETVPIGPPYDDNVTGKVGEILRAATAIKPGQTRRDLQKDFTTEGGISIETQRRYVSRVCPIIKIDVEFKPASSEDESLDDVIVSVSKPFVESSISD